MKLIEALNYVNQAAAADAKPFRVALVCGFTPLHLQTFLHAELQQSLPDRRVEMVTGVFGDITGTLENIVSTHTRVDAVAVAIEWSDLDARLGVRRLGGWSPRNFTSILERVNTWLSHLRFLVEKVSEFSPVAISLPTLPLPPLFLTTNSQASHWELELRDALASLAANVSLKSKVRIVNGQTLDQISPLSERLSVKSEWSSGFPYHNAHASHLANVLARLILNLPPRKGLITDLDNTMWNGIVGEVGAQGINWDLDNHSQGFGLYQQMLQTLSEEGVLVAAVSKNDPAMVEEAFKREDLLISRESLSFLEASWASKAGAVRRILSGWNIAPDSVVFVDDNPIEIAEVQAAFPEIHCLEFPSKDAKEIYELISKLRDLFGKERISDEDRLRRQSIRANVERRNASEDDTQGFSEALLEHADAHLTLSFRKDPGDSRAFELVNKTNQFNLNGKRFTEADWQTYLAQGNVFLLTASYKDRFGPLGKISVVAGRAEARALYVDVWVMSCRAFARRIEHQCLNRLFERFDAEKITFAYLEQPRNRPIFSFLEGLATTDSDSNPQISRQAFQAACPRLFHHVVELD